MFDLPLDRDLSEHRVDDDLLLRLLIGGDAGGDAWQSRALCAQTDPEEFFPEKGMSPRGAKQVCAACPVRKECLTYALENDERFGIWGGMSARERASIRDRAA